MIMTKNRYGTDRLLQGNHKNFFQMAKSADSEKCSLAPFMAILSDAKQFSPVIRVVEKGAALNYIKIRRYNQKCPMIIFFSRVGWSGPAGSCRF